MQGSLLHWENQQPAFTRFNSALDVNVYVHSSYLKMQYSDIRHQLDWKETYDKISAITTLKARPGRGLSF